MYIALAWSRVLSATPRPLVVDLGYGAYPWTALEIAARWRNIAPGLRLLGIEIDPERVEAALPYARPGHIDFARGGFNIADLTGTREVTIIRAYNVLRQYDESEVGAALWTMAEALTEGGLLIEGTSNPSGRLTVFDVYQRQGEALVHRELVFASNRREGAEPRDFQAVLPKRLIHHAHDAELDAFFNAWGTALMLARAAGAVAPSRRWVSAGRMMRARFGDLIDPRDRLLRRGYLVLRDPLRPTP